MSKLINMIRGFWLRFKKARIPSLSASLAFHSLLSFVPLVTLGFWYLSYAGITQYWIETAHKWLVSHLDFGSDSKVIEIFNTLTSTGQSYSWGWVGLGIFVYTLFSLLFSVGDALDQVLKAREIQLNNMTRGMWSTLFRRFLFLLLLPLVLAVSTAIMSWIKHDSFIKKVFEIEFVGSYLAMPLPWSLDLLAFFLLYHYVPNTFVPARQAFRAALFSTPLFILGKFGMAQYSTYALTTQKIYGAFAVIPLLMLWVNLAWMIVLSGALFIRETPQKNPHKERPHKR